MRKLLFILLIPLSSLAQNPFSTYELVKDSVKVIATDIAKTKADSIFAALKIRIDSAITVIPNVTSPKGLVTTTALAQKPDTGTFLPPIRATINAKASMQSLMDTSATKPDKCGTLAELRLMPVRDGRVVVVADKATAFDNTGGFYRWNPNATGAEDAKYLNTIISSLSSTGRWIRMFQRAVDISPTNGTMLTLAGNYKEYTVSGTTNSSGQIVWNLTDDGTATGNALFASTKIILVEVDQDQPLPEDAVTPRRISLSSNLKVLTYGFSKPKINPVTTALALIGVSIVPTQSVAAGVPATLTIKGLTP